MPSHNPNNLKRDATVTIPFAHLNPKLQAIVGMKKADSLGQVRIGRGMAEAIVAGQTILAFVSPAMAGSLAAMGTAARALYAKRIQALHAELQEAMSKYGVMQTKYEEQYPERWIDPARIANTHPIYCVNGKGDLIFRKNTRMEYYLYLAQKKFPGRFGLTTWRWRNYIKPPEAPETAKAWAARKLEELRLALAKPKPMPFRIRTKTMPHRRYRA